MTPEPIIPLVHAFIDSRDAAGLTTYGKPLATFDGRNTIADAQEEAGDLLNYLTKLRCEWEALADLLERAAWMIDGMAGCSRHTGQALKAVAELLATAEKMRHDVARVGGSSAAYRTPAERLAQMSAGGER